jgi:2-polyprenyl-3-methyl-5-hydroxy-6-metoxy-1,4-benzoquinol methylase
LLVPGFYARATAPGRAGAKKAEKIGLAGSAKNREISFNRPRLVNQWAGAYAIAVRPTAAEMRARNATQAEKAFMFETTIRDRFEIIEPYVRGDCRVMDLGCVDARHARHNSTTRIEYKANLLHKRIAEVNPRVLGVDIDREGISVLKSKGFNVTVADVQTMDLDRQFDTVVAGEIIEHLENPGGFLRNMHQHLRPGGVIIISSPNPFYAGSSWKIWRYGKPAVHEEHVSWQDPTTLTQLLKRTGFEPIEGYWIQPIPKLFKTWKRLLRPYFSHSFMIVAEKAVPQKPVLQPAEVKPAINVEHFAGAERH